MADPVSDLRASVDKLDATIERLREDLVRKDVYAVDQRLVSARIDNVADDVRDLAKQIERAEDKRAADRRLVVASLLLPIVVVVVNLYLAARIGGS